MEKFRWGYIGSGNIAMQVAMSTERKGHNIGCIYSRNPNTSKKLCEKYGAQYCGTIKELINSDKIDGVYICTPHTSHKEYAIKCLQAGIPVLCEKPVGINVKEVTEMVECARENNTYFCEAMWTWFSPVALKVKEWVDSGKIGKIKKVKVSYAFPGMMMKKTSRVRDPKTAGGALLDVGIYPITYCYKLFGYPKAVKCDGKIKDGIDVKENIVLSYDGFDCEIEVSLYKLKEGMKIIGTEGKINIPVFHIAQMATLKAENNKDVFKGKTDYITEFNCCVDEIKTGKKESDFIPFSQTIDCMKIMDECRKQMGLRYPCE